MNRQQAPQPVVRPVQVGDFYNLLLDTDVRKENVWYLAKGITEENADYAAAVRPVNGVMQIAVLSSEVDFWCSLGTQEGDVYTITSITHGSDTLHINNEVINDYVQSMGCRSYDYIIAEPVNVYKWFEV